MSMQVGAGGFWVEVDYKVSLLEAARSAGLGFGDGVERRLDSGPNWQALLGRQMPTGRENVQFSMVPVLGGLSPREVFVKIPPLRRPMLACEFVAFAKSFMENGKFICFGSLWRLGRRYEMLVVNERVCRFVPTAHFCISGPCHVPVVDWSEKINKPPMGF